MSTLRKRLASVEERTEFLRHMEFIRQFKARSEDDRWFLCFHGYWTENATVLPHRIEFTARGIKTIVTTQWASEDSEDMSTE